MIDVSRSAASHDLGDCPGAGVGRSARVIKTFLADVVRDFGRHSLFSLPDRSLAGSFSGRGGQVQISAITFSQKAEIAFGFLGDEADILGNLTQRVDFSGPRPFTFVHKAIDLAVGNLLDTTRNRHAFRNGSHPVFMVIVSDGQSNLPEDHPRAIEDAVAKLDGLLFPSGKLTKAVFQVGSEPHGGLLSRLASSASSLRNPSGSWSTAPRLLFPLTCSPDLPTQLGAQIRGELEYSVPCSCSTTTTTTVSTTTTTTVVECYKDVVFVVDDSTSVIDPEFCGARKHFDDLKSFMKEAVQEMSGSIHSGHTRIGLVRFASDAELLFGLTNDLAAIVKQLDYDFPRAFRRMTLSNMHLGLQKAQQSLAAGDASFAGAARRHLHVVVLSDFSLRSNGLQMCDDDTDEYESCLNATGVQLLDQQLARLPPLFSVGSSRQGVTRWAYTPGCDIVSAPQMVSSVPSMVAVQGRVATQAGASAACSSGHSGTATAEAAHAMAGAIGCDKDCAPPPTTATPATTTTTTASTTTTTTTIATATATDMTTTTTLTTTATTTTATATTTLTRPTTAAAAVAQCAQFGGPLAGRYFAGPALAPVLLRAGSPDGAGWKWWECAAECAHHSDCQYWYVPAKSKTCVMKRRRTTALVVAPAAVSLGHGDRDSTCNYVDPGAPCQIAPSGCEPCPRLPTSGYFRGELLRVLKKKDAPNGGSWAWYQCAGRCAAEEGCAYWYLHPKTRNCMLKSTKTGALVNVASSGGHGMRSAACTGYNRDNQPAAQPDGSLGGGCTQLPGAARGFYGGKLLEALPRKLSPSRRGWAWYECAGRCSGTPGSCAYWYVTTAKVCVLRAAKASSPVPNSRAIAHGLRSTCDGFCPSPAAGCNG